LGEIPTELKIAKIILIYKLGDRKLPENYRPISLLSIFEKITEKLMYSRLSNFLEKTMYYTNTNLALEKIIRRLKQ